MIRARSAEWPERPGRARAARPRAAQRIRPAARARPRRGRAGRRACLLGWAPLRRSGTHGSGCRPACATAVSLAASPSPLHRPLPPPPPPHTHDRGARSPRGRGARRSAAAGTGSPTPTPTPTRPWWPCTRTRCRPVAPRLPAPLPLPPTTTSFFSRTPTTSFVSRLPAPPSHFPPHARPATATATFLLLSDSLNLPAAASLAFAL